MSWILPVLLLSSAVAAQEPREPPREPPPRVPQSRAPESRVPESFMPPAGLCRLWIDGVPASQQPAPTDCASAIRNRPSNAAIVFGPQRRGESTEMRPFAGRAVAPVIRKLAPGASQLRARDDTSDRAADTVVKPAPRKPEKPQ